MRSLHPGNQQGSHRDGKERMFLHNNTYLYADLIPTGLGCLVLAMCLVLQTHVPQTAIPTNDSGGWRHHVPVLQLLISLNHSFH